MSPTPKSQRFYLALLVLESDASRAQLEAALGPVGGITTYAIGVNAEVDATLRAVTVYPLPDRLMVRALRRRLNVALGQKRPARRKRP